VQTGLPERVDWMTWRAAMERALYGPAGFYRRELPNDHFRTATTSEVFADAVTVLVDDVDRALGRPSEIRVVDVGAGAGELLCLLADRLPDRLRLTGVDVRDRPADLPDRVEWCTEMAPDDRVVGVVLANELLDNVPVDVVEVDAAGQVRQVLVDPTSGDERLGPSPEPTEQSWLDRWWPLTGAPEGTRAEVGSPRDERWIACTDHLVAGLAVAIDYDHQLGSRPDGGSLVGYRDGRTVPPVPDGSCDLTAHVALDACAGALTGRHAGDEIVVGRQRTVLHALGVDPRRPLPSCDTAAYVRGLARASDAWWLTGPDGLGDFGWLALARQIPLPSALAGSVPAS
jgi:SAM-dependent MidA family methyltransferase